MTLDKAIELLADEAESPRYTYDPDRRDAFKVGIEALRRLKKLRDNYSPYSIAPLPGETEE